MLTGSVLPSGAAAAERRSPGSRRRYRRTKLTYGTGFEDGYASHDAFYTVDAATMLPHDAYLEPPPGLERNPNVYESHDAYYTVDAATMLPHERVP